MGAGCMWMWKRALPVGASDVALVFRGTHTLDDLAVDAKMVLAADETQAALFNVVITKLLADVIQKLREPTVYPELQGKHLILCGHSLGATYAEAIFMMLEKAWPEPTKPWVSIEAVTFDSPGQPDSFRAVHSIVLPVADITTLNAVPNLINTLQVPCAMKLFSCSPGSQIHLTGLFAWLRSIISPAFLLSYLVRNTNTHALDEISRHVNAGTILSELPHNWPVYSRSIVKFVRNAISTWTSAVSGLFTTKTIPISLPAVNDPPVLAAVAPAPPRPSPPPVGLLELPSSLDGILDGNAYYISDASVWERFTTMLHLSDKVIVLLGATGQGKTSVFKVLANLPHEFVLPITAGANSSLYPLIARAGHYVDDANVQRSVFAIDMPGHGSAAQVAHPSFAVSNNFDQMYRLIGSHVPCALFVQRELVSDLTRTYFHRVAQHGFRLIRVLNRGAGMPDSDWSKRQMDICSTLQHENCHSGIDLTCTAITSHEYREGSQLRENLDVVQIENFRRRLLNNELQDVPLCVSRAPQLQVARVWNVRGCVSTAGAFFAVLLRRAARLPREWKAKEMVVIAGTLVAILTIGHKI
jgi:hypothetical protein